MQELLKALASEDEEKVEELAKKLFITKEGKANSKAMADFEKASAYVFVLLEKDYFGFLVEKSENNRKVYSFG